MHREFLISGNERYLLGERSDAGNAENAGNACSANNANSGRNANNASNVANARGPLAETPIRHSAIAIRLMACVAMCIESVRQTLISAALQQLSQMFNMPIPRRERA